MDESINDFKHWFHLLINYLWIATIAFNINNKSKKTGWFQTFRKDLSNVLQQLEFGQSVVHFVWQCWSLLRLVYHHFTLKKVQKVFPWYKSWYGARYFLKMTSSIFDCLVKDCNELLSSILSVRTEFFLATWILLSSSSSSNTSCNLIFVLFVL